MRRILVTSTLSVFAVCAIGGAWLWFLVTHQLHPVLSSQSKPTATAIPPRSTTNPPVNSSSSVPPDPPPALTVNDLPMLKAGSTSPSVLRLQELLANLGYLPVHWTASMPAPAAGQAQLSAVLHPPGGTWTWSTAAPQSLKALWKPGLFNVMTAGAVMDFQQDHRLEADGVAGPQVWSTLLTAEANHERNPSSYAYVAVSQKQPQALRIWDNGKIVLTARVNTGIAASPTVDGTFPVYLQYRTQTMSGTTPSGEHYSDPGVPWVSYFYGGEAIHGFIRPGYGYPQSLGCVELPLQQAEQAWKYIHIGTLVTISG